MALADGTHRFDPRSSVEVRARAPGHDFSCRGGGLEGEVVVADGEVVQASARFPLAALQAGDPLGNRELRRFTAAPSRSAGRGPAVVRDPASLGSLEFTAQPPRGSGAPGSPAAGAHPVAFGALVGPVRLEAGPSGGVRGRGQLRLWVESGPVAEAEVSFEGQPPRVALTLETSFTRLGYTPPKLLFFKVRDELQVRIEILLGA